MAFLDFWTGIDTEEEQARQDTLDAQLRLENEKDRARRGEEWFNQANAHIDAGAINVNEQTENAFFGIDDSNDNRIDTAQANPKALFLAVAAIGIAYFLFFKK